MDATLTAVRIAGANDLQIDRAGIGWWTIVCLGTTFVVALLVGLAAKRWVAPWAREQVLLAPLKRLRPLKWCAEVLLVAALAFSFDKVDVSALLDGVGSATDVWAATATLGFLIAYCFALDFLWGCESAIERDAATASIKLSTMGAQVAMLSQLLSGERRLSKYLNAITSGRWSRLRALLGDQDHQGSMHDLAKALGPEIQFAEVIVTIWRLVSMHYRGGIDSEHQLRVAYYEPKDGRLVCIASYDGVHANCIRNPNDGLASSFALTEDRARDCLAVHCALRAPREPFVIEDARVAAADPVVPFSFLSETQQDHIASIVGYCCRRADSDQAPHPVITIDCSQRGFFKSSSESVQELGRILDELSFRAIFERDIHRICQEFIPLRETAQ